LRTEDRKEDRNRDKGKDSDARCRWQKSTGDESPGIYNNRLNHSFFVSPRVYLLKPGSIRKDDTGTILDAKSSVTLISTGTHRIIVDTGLGGEEKIILGGLAEMGLNPEDIDSVINTHTHQDHTGNNFLFSGAKVITPKEGDLIAPGVKIIATPGHTMDSISVVVLSQNVVVLAGDALPTLSNYIKGVPPAHHVDRILACRSMSRILQIADVVVPGHDRPFSVLDKAYASFQY
jgi:glyoxylase-like metal-dependent hydrolase (beta-lactamase superfamily II)